MFGFKIIRNSDYENLCNRLETAKKNCAVLYQKVDKLLAQANDCARRPTQPSQQKQLEDEKAKVATLRRQCQEKEQRIISLKSALRKKHPNFESLYTVIPDNGHCEGCQHESSRCRKFDLTDGHRVCVIPK